MALWVALVSRVEVSKNNDPLLTAVVSPERAEKTKSRSPGGHKSMRS